MRFLPCLILMSCFVASGCGNSDSTTQTNGTSENSNNVANSDATSESISLNVADLEKLDSWDATSKASAKLTEMLAEITAGIKDEETAKAAIPKLQELAPKFAAVSRAEKAFGEPSKEDRIVVFENLADANKKFDQAYTAISEKDDLMALAGQAIDDAYVGNVTE